MMTLATKLSEVSQSLNPCCNGIYLIIGKWKQTKWQRRLNPCCNGIYLITLKLLAYADNSSLNPCCNGIYLIIDINECFKRFKEVLILVVMEYT